MPGLVADISPVVSQDQPYSNTVAGMVNKLRFTQDPYSLDLADALETLQNTDDHIQGMLRQNAPELHDLEVTDALGNVVADIGEIENEDGTISYGAWFRSIYVGGESADTAPFWADQEGNVFIGKNGTITVLDPFDAGAAWLGTQFDWLPVSGATDNGAGLIRLTVFAHTLQTGDEVMVDLVGNVPNANGTRIITVIDADHIDLQGSVWADGPYTTGGIIDRVLHIVGAVASGLAIRITVDVEHGYEGGDQVDIRDVGGVPNANGQWLVTPVNDFSFDLRNSAFAGAYTSGGTALRYFAGGLFRTIAIGNSFADYSLRAFADGTLRIRNATIILTDGDQSIILDPSGPSIIVSDASTGWQTRLQDGQIYVEDLSDGSRSVQITPELIFLVNSTGGAVVSMSSTLGGDSGQILIGNGAATTISLLGNNGDILSDGNVTADGTVTAAEYVIDGIGVPVISSTADGVLNSLTLVVPLAIADGGTGASDAAFARANLGVYSTTQVDSIIAALATTLNGSHTHGGAVAADGAHTHTIV